MKAKHDIEGNRIQNVAQVYHGVEPKWVVSDRSLKSRIGEAINWYSVSYDNKDFKSWVLKHFKSNGFNTNFQSDVVDFDFRSAGILLRLKEKGCPFTDEWEAKLNSAINKLKARVEKPTSVVVEKSRYDKIQATMAARAKNTIGILEGLLDDILLGKVAVTASTTWESLKVTIPDTYLPNVNDRLDDNLMELEEVLEAFIAKTPSEEQLELCEGYSNFTPKTLTAYINSLQHLQNICQVSIKKAVVTKEASKKPKKVKPVDVDKLVARCLFQKSMVDPSITSLLPKKVVGADQIVLFETNKRVITILKASGENGLTIKGSSVYGFDEKLCIRKTVRKPEIFLPQIVKASKPQSKNLIKELVAKDQEISGRMNGYTVIVRID
jgi:hypothetical protein